MTLTPATQEMHDKAVLPPNQKWHTNPDGSRVAVPGSTIIHGSLVTIEPDVKLGQEVQLFGIVHLLAESEIGNWCRINGCTIQSSRIGDFSIVDERSDIRGSQLGQSNWVWADAIVKRSTSGKGATIGRAVVEDATIDENEYYTG